MSKNKSINPMNKKNILLTRILRIIIILLYTLLFLRILLLIIPFPEYDQFIQREYSLSILDRNGEILQVLPLEDGSRREYSSIEDIPKHTINAFIQSEDKRFFSHSGIDILSLVRAIIQNTARGEIVSGASTITMQLSRIIAPHEPGIWGKVCEVVNAFRIESRLTKYEILELWLNSIPFGSRAEGISTAGKVFFGKSIEELSEIESLILSIIPRRPAIYNPLENSELVKKVTLDLAHRIGVNISEG